LLRTLGVESFVINIVVQDGLFVAPISRHVHALHTLYYMRDEDGDVDEKHYTMKNSDLVFVVKCISHSICNACKWGLADVVSERIVDDSYIVMESLRGGSTFLLQHVAQFLQASLAFGPCTETEEDIVRFWEFLGVPIDLMDLFVELHPRFVGNQLLVRPTLEGDVDCFEKASTCVMFAMRWLRCTETRWARKGVSARAFFLSLSLGVDGIVKLCDDDTDVTMFNLNGFRKASTGVRRYLAVAACASFPLDSASIAFLEDDRLLLVGSDVWSDMVRDVGYVLGLPKKCLDIPCELRGRRCQRR
jgi:hypothetical protein